MATVTSSAKPTIVPVVSDASTAVVAQDTDAEVSSRADIDLVIVTGVSGGGRSTVARALENVGFYVVDNLPQRLLLNMVELAHAAGPAGRRTAVVLDVRSRAFTVDLGGAVRELRERGCA